MPTTSEYNLFRRLIGDFDKNEVPNSSLDALLDDATFEVTNDFTPPVTDFDVLVVQYHPEIIYKAAINYWWNKLGNWTEKYSVSAGAQSQNVGERWDRVMQIIQQLEQKYQEISYLGTEIAIGNLSRFSKESLTRIGGQNEEDVMNG